MFHQNKIITATGSPVFIFLGIFYGAKFHNSNINKTHKSSKKTWSEKYFNAVIFNGGLLYYIHLIKMNNCACIIVHNLYVCGLQTDRKLSRRYVRKNHIGLREIYEYKKYKLFSIRNWWSYVNSSHINITLYNQMNFHLQYLYGLAHFQKISTQI